MTLTNAVALRVEELLKTHNKSQYRLIKQTCLDKSTIQAIFKGKTKDVKLSTIALIAESFDLTLEEFFASEIFSTKNLEI